MGSTTIEAPTPSSQESQIYDTILSQINQYNDYNQMMMPIQMKQAGYEWQYKSEYLDEEGNLKPDVAYREDPEELKKRDALWGQYNQLVNSPEYNNPMDRSVYKQAEAIKAQAEAMTEKFRKEKSEWAGPKEGDINYGQWAEMSDEAYYGSLNAQEKLQYDLQKAQAERSLAAIEGTLDFSPALEEQRQKEWDQLKQVYGTIEGDDWANATASDTVGQQNLDQFKRRWTMMEEAVRHGQAGSDIQSAALASGLTTGQTANRIGTTQALGQGYGASIPMYQSVLNPMQQYNMAGWQTGVYNAANQSAQTGSLLGLGGMLGVGLLRLASSKEYKTGLKTQTKEAEDKALKLIMKTRSYKYKYKPEMNLGNKTHLGTITEESPREIVAPGGKAINLGDKLELQSMAIKALARKIQKRRSA